MRQILQYGILSALLFCSDFTTAQDISLYQQFNGRYDFVFFGNTLNPVENHIMLTPEIYTSSSADFTLNDGDLVHKAFLYWAGCGTGDFEVELNGNPLIAERTFSHQRLSGNLTMDYFSAFYDVTSLVQSTGEGVYTLSELDLTGAIPYFFQNKTNFGGWAIIVIYENPALPLNQLNMYDGMQAMPDAIDITLSSLNVIDNDGAKIGFLAWEGDANIANNETLKINNILLSNPPLNPSNNAFNGTNSFTNSAELYNMDLDVYDIQNYIQVTDSVANISMTSSQDVVMINAIVTKLNSQLPDATITIDDVALLCDSRIITVDFTVYNLNSTDVLPSGVPISIYADGVFVAYTETIQPLPIGGQGSDSITFILPDGIPNDFELTFIVDQMQNGEGTIKETDETNNQYSVAVSLLLPPAFNSLPPVTACNEGFGVGTFDFSHYEELIKINPAHMAVFYETFDDATNESNPIYNATNYNSGTTPREIFVRITDEIGCVSIASFLLQTRNCPPTIYNFISANGDGANDSFFIDGLRDIFLNFELNIYNRWGVLLWTGNQNLPDWDGMATNGSAVGSGPVPDGTYYYVLHLNDPDYTEPMTGFLYITR